VKKISILFSFVIFCVSAYAQERPFVREKPFFNPQNIAQEIGNSLVDIGNPIMFDWGSEKNGYVRYCSRIYDYFGRIYEICFYVYHDGRRDLEIDYYLTTSNLVKLNPADVVVNELIYGKPKITQEIHMNDFGVDGNLDIYQMFHKHRNSVWEGFTREERDLGKRAGVKEYLYHSGSIYHKKRFLKDGWKSASEKEKKEVQNDYWDHIVLIKELISK